ncbi:lig1 [Scenedesmus sp. PABB004]|nr:lig1 [Scenedesmus sp. PABB004]
MKQRDIGSFFGAKPAPAAPKPAKAAPAAKENLDEGPAKRAKGDGDGGRLKRLKRACDADGAAAAPPAEDEQQELEDEVLEDAAPAEGAAADGAGGGAAAAAKSPAKLSSQEASAAFKSMFGGARAKAGGNGKGKGKQPAAKSPAKQPAAAGAQRGAEPEQAQQQQAQPQQEPQKQAQEGGGEAAAAASPAKRRKRGSKASGSKASDGDGADAGSDGDADSDADSDGGAGEAAAAAAAAAAASPSKAKAKARAKPAGKKSTKGSAMEGVGTGALAAAQAALAVDVAGSITWPAGKPVPYAFLTDTFEAIASTSKRLECTGLLTGAFRAILASTPGDLLPAIYLCTNRVAPAHTGVELGVGDALLIKARPRNSSTRDTRADTGGAARRPLARAVRRPRRQTAAPQALAGATGKKEGGIKKDYEESGDLGSVAAAARGAQRTMFPQPPLTIGSVLKAFRDIAKESGQASQARKVGLISKLLVASKGVEPGYIIRSLQAKLRIGLAEQSVLVAIAHSVLLHKEGASDKDGLLAERLEAAAQAVKAAYSECPSYDVLVPALLDHPLSELPARVAFTPGVPVHPMLAKPTTGVGEVLEKFSGTEFTCEYKYDGERVQIHVLDGGARVHIYSRNSEDMTRRYPDILARLPGWLAPGTESIVIDGEAVAWDPEKQKILPFQVLSTRARKEVALADVKVQVCVYAFDCLYLNGSSLLHEPLTARRDALSAGLVEVPGQLTLATAKTSTDVEELEAFLNEAVDAATEGLIVKTLADAYEPSKRSAHWLKLKKDYLAGVGDTFDVVPIGAFYGRGKRAGVFGAYLLAVYDEERETYQTISKLGTGFSEEQLTALAEALRPSIIPAPRPYYQFGESGAPDVWFAPAAVWEVKAADLSISPLHQAALGLVEPGKGISIRFPRLVRVRDDKSPEDATTAQQPAGSCRALRTLLAAHAPSPPRRAAPPPPAAPSLLGGSSMSSVAMPPVRAAANGGVPAGLLEAVQRCCLARSLSELADLEGLERAAWVDSIDGTPDAELLPLFHDRRLVWWAARAIVHGLALVEARPAASTAEQLEAACLNLCRATWFLEASVERWRGGQAPQRTAFSELVDAGLLPVLEASCAAHVAVFEAEERDWQAEGPRMDGGFHLKLADVLITSANAVLAACSGQIEAAPSPFSPATTAAAAQALAVLEPAAQLACAVLRSAPAWAAPPRRARGLGVPGGPALTDLRAFFGSGLVERRRGLLQSASELAVRWVNDCLPALSKPAAERTLALPAVQQLLAASLALAACQLHAHHDGAAEPLAVVPGHHLALLAALGMGDGSWFTPSSSNGGILKAEPCAASTVIYIFRLVLQQPLRFTPALAKAAAASGGDGGAALRESTVAGVSRVSLVVAELAQIFLREGHPRLTKNAVDALVACAELLVGRPQSHGGAEPPASAAAVGACALATELVLRVLPALLAAPDSDSISVQLKAQAVQHACEVLIPLEARIGLGATVADCFSQAPGAVAQALEAVVRSLGRQAPEERGNTSAALMWAAQIVQASDLPALFAAADGGGSRSGASGRRGRAGGSCSEAAPPPGGGGQLQGQLFCAMLAGVKAFAAAEIISRLARHGGLAGAAQQGRAVAAAATKAAARRGAAGRAPAAGPAEQGPGLWLVLAARCLAAMAGLLDRHLAAASAGPPPAGDVLDALVQQQEVVQLLGERLRLVQLEACAGAAHERLLAKQQKLQAALAGALDAGGAAPGAALAAQAQVFAAAVCAAVPLACCCNHAACGSQAGLSELELVRGKSSRCAGCKAVRFCSMDCQTAAWPAHRPVCKRLKAAAAAAAEAPGSSKGARRR